MKRLIAFFILLTMVQAQAQAPKGSAPPSIPTQRTAPPLPKTQGPPNLPLGSPSQNSLSTTTPALPINDSPAYSSDTSGSNLTAGPASPVVSYGSNDIKRDPFRLPQYLINKLKVVVPIAVDGSRIDDSVDPIRRWPLSNYILIGIIWDVKNPKALVSDQQKKVHLVRLKDKIGNQGGVITSIREGSMLVMQEKSPQVMKLKK